NFIVLRNLFLDAPFRIRKSMSNANQCFFEPVESRALSGQRLLLNDIVMEIVAGCVDLACCENPVDKFSDTGFVVFGHNASTGEIWIRALTIKSIGQPISA